MKQTDLGTDLYNGTITGGVAASLTAAQAIKNASGPSVLTTYLEQPSGGGDCSGRKRSETFPSRGRMERQGCDVHSEFRGATFCSGFKPRQSAQARTLGYQQDISPTINTDENYAVHIEQQR